MKGASSLLIAALILSIITNSWSSKKGNEQEPFRSLPLAQQVGSLGFTTDHTFWKRKHYPLDSELKLIIIVFFF